MGGKGYTVCPWFHIGEWGQERGKVSGMEVGDSNPHEEPSVQDSVILNPQHLEKMSNENLVQFLQDMYIYTRVVQFQYEVPATLSIKALPPPPLPGLNPPNRPSRSPPILAPLPTNNLESLEFPALSPRKKKKSRASSVGSPRPSQEPNMWYLCVTQETQLDNAARHD